MRPSLGTERFLLEFDGVGGTSIVRWGVMVRKFFEWRGPWLLASQVRGGVDCRSHFLSKSLSRRAAFMRNDAAPRMVP